MKTLKIISVAIGLLLIAHQGYSQTDTVRIRTSAICEDCKERIEHDLSFEKGVKSVNQDLTTKIATVIYSSKKTNEQNIREAITKIGYDADSLKADLKSFNKLPDCCKNPNIHH